MRPRKAYVALAVAGALCGMLAGFASADSSVSQRDMVFMQALLALELQQAQAAGIFNPASSSVTRWHTTSDMKTRTIDTHSH